MKEEILMLAIDLQSQIEGINRELETAYQIAEKKGLYKEADLIEHVQFNSKFSTLGTKLDILLDKVCSYVETVEQVNNIDINEYRRVKSIINQIKDIVI